MMYTLYVRQKLERSLKAVSEGKVTSHEEAKKKGGAVLFILLPAEPAAFPTL